MALYTVFAWTAIVLAGGAYYWIYIRRQPLPIHLLGLSPSPTTSIGDSSSSATSRKRKKEASKHRPPLPQTSKLSFGASGNQPGNDGNEPHDQVSVQNLGNASAQGSKSMLILFFRFLLYRRFSLYQKVHQSLDPL
jgi:hypothetical protein